MGKTPYLLILVSILSALLSMCGNSDAQKTETVPATTAETIAETTLATLPQETTLPYIEPATTAEPTTQPPTTIPPETTIPETEPPTEAPPAPIASTEPETEPEEEMVWIPSSGSKYHSRSGCSGMENPSHVPLSTAIARGFTACKRCH